MDAINATWKNGQIVPDGPVDWPDGLRLVVEPASASDGSTGSEEDDWPNSPAAIADWLQWYDSLEPLIFTSEEEADIAAWRQKVRDYTIANSPRSLEGLFE